MSLKPRLVRGFFWLTAILDSIPTGWYGHLCMPPSAKTKLLEAAVDVIRARGYSATTVDDICQSAGVTKGAFFHHFAAKEELAVAAARHFSSRADGLFSTAPYRKLLDPVDRLVGYVEFRKALLQGRLPEFTCLLGTMVQEVYQTHPAIRQACERGFGEHVAMLEADIAAALRTYGGHGRWRAGSLAIYMQAVIQGAFILAKAHKGPAVAAACLDHLGRYIQTLFSEGQKSKQAAPRDDRHAGARARRRAQRGAAGVRTGSKNSRSARGAGGAVPHERSTRGARPGA
jgi:TetR/AcrR family transcriptional regulator, transcriptional repressor for nem operon